MVLRTDRFITVGQSALQFFILYIFISDITGSAQTGLYVGYGVK